MKTKKLIFNKLTREELNSKIIQICMKYGIAYDHFVSEHNFLVKSLENKQTHVRINITYHPETISFSLLEELSKFLNTKDINIEWKDGDYQTCQYLIINSPIQFKEIIRDLE